MSSPDVVTGPELLAKANEAFSPKGQQIFLMPNETMIGEPLPVYPGEVLAVTCFDSYGRRPLIRFRVWRIAPDGSKQSTRWGFNLPAGTLPQFAGMIAKALDLPALRDAERNT